MSNLAAAERVGPCLQEGTGLREFDGHLDGPLDGNFLVSPEPAVVQSMGRNVRKCVLSDDALGGGRTPCGMRHVDRKLENGVTWPDVVPPRHERPGAGHRSTDHRHLLCPAASVSAVRMLRTCSSSCCHHQPVVGIRFASATSGGRARARLDNCPAGSAAIGASCCWLRRRPLVLAPKCAVGRRSSCHVFFCGLGLRPRPLLSALLYSLPTFFGRPRTSLS